MSRCVAEMCVYWDGGEGCVCAIFGLDPIMDEKLLYQESEYEDEGDE